MNESQRISKLLRRAFEGKSWHGPAVAEVLSGVSAAQAAARPPIGSHSIWELVLHMQAWTDEVLARLARGSIELPAGHDWPAVVDTSEAAWHAAQARLADSHRQLVEGVAALADERLAENVGGERHSIYAMLHGLIHHDLYHAGQIALLKSAHRA